RNGKVALCPHHELAETVAPVVKPPGVHARQQATVGVMALVVIRRADIGLDRIRNGGPRHQVGEPRIRVEPGIPIIAIPTAVMILDHIKNEGPGVKPLEGIVSKRARHLTAQVHVLEHRRYEMRFALGRRLYHHGSYDLGTKERSTTVSGLSLSRGKFWALATH